MTADNFTEAAREEFYRVWHSPIHDHSQIGMAIHMAEWARDHLAAQEPTEEEVEAAAEAICSGEGGCDPCFNWDDSVAGGCTYCTRHARAALSASRRNEKNR